MTTGSFDIGDRKKLTITLTDEDGAVADPTWLAFKMKEPDGTETTYGYLTDEELVKSATGIYYVDWPFAQAGRHVFRFTATGALVTAEQEEVYVRRGI